jgi:hypothetical protein
MLEKWEKRKDYDGILRVVAKETMQPDTGRSSNGVNVIEELDESYCHLCEDIEHKVGLYQQSTESIIESYDEIYSKYVQSQNENE